jgi:membrane-associated protein
MLEIFNVQDLVRSSSYLLLAGIIFAESGLFFGFIFPGDSLLFLAGFAASQGYFNIVILTVLFFTSAILGDNVGYAFGKHTGKRIFKREDSLFFHKDHLRRAEEFFEKHGGKTIVMARFIPVVRTFAPILAGVGRMNYRTFFLYNLMGAVIWAIGVTLSGYFLGRLVPNADRYLVPIVIAILATSFLPTIMHFIKDKRFRTSFLNQIKKFIRKIYG